MSYVQETLLGTLCSQMNGTENSANDVRSVTINTSSLEQISYGLLEEQEWKHSMTESLDLEPDEGAAKKRN